jgi:16S rRNA (uracil1498-N3)-methyltransferase
VTLPTFVHPSTASLRAGVAVELTGPEGHHAAVVRRLRSGEQLHLTDGAGATARAEVVALGRASLDLQVLDVWTDPAPVPRLVVVQALTKGERGELAVELLTEVGVDTVVPWEAARSVARWRGERGDKALRRWRTTAREAAKQARRSWFPQVTAPVSTEEVAGLLRGAATAVVLHQSATRPVGEVVPARQDDVAVVVGPEGGITDEELAVLVAAGGVPARLGPTVLRASSAGVVAAAALLARTSRWA